MPARKYGPSSRCLGMGKDGRPCTRPVMARGMCWTHYNRTRRQEERGAPIDLVTPIVSPGSRPPTMGITVHVPEEVGQALTTTAQLIPGYQTGTISAVVRDILVKWYNEKYLMAQIFPNRDAQQ